MYEYEISLEKLYIYSYININVLLNNLPLL
jgi:hypothetical protein